ncbi:hypothetical protein ABGA94_17065, partial [Stenotrophomonas sp. 3diitr2024]
VLTALREGPQGARGLNSRIEQLLAGNTPGYFQGRLLLVTQVGQRVCQVAPGLLVAFTVYERTTQPDRECHVVEAGEGDGSAGNAAFRATGNEPGWLAVVDGDMPGLQVEV